MESRGGGGMRWGTRTVALAALMGIAGTAIPAHEDAVVELVAAPGDQAIGMTIGDILEPTPMTDRMSIAPDGSVLFTADLRDSGGGLLTADALVTGKKDALTFLTAPGETIAHGTVTALENYRVSRIDSAHRNPDGNTVVECITTDNTFFLPTLLTFIGGTQSVGAVEFHPFDGVCALDELGNQAFAGAHALGGDSLVFIGKSRPGCPDELQRVYVRDGSNTPVAVAVEDSIVPGTTDDRFVDFFNAPVANSAGDILFTGRSADFGAIDILLAMDATGPLRQIAMVGDTITGGELKGFAAWTIGPPVQAGSPRVAYVARAEAAGAVRTVQVFDSAHGASPVVATGATAGGLTFAVQPTQFSAQVGLAIAEFGQLFLVGETTGPGVKDGSAHGIWRYDPREAPDLEVLLYEGGRVLGSPVAETRTITSIKTVSVNTRGLVAAEVELSDGNEAILLERAGAAQTTFVVALEEGDQVPTRTGTATLESLLFTTPTFPEVSRSGSDGGRSRFSERGLFVFKGRVNFGSGIRSGVYTVTVEDPEQQQTCDVEASVKGGNLLVRGGAGGCSVTIESKANGNVDVIPGKDTTVNGQNATWSGVFTKSMDVRMGGGDDAVTIRSTQPAGSFDSPTDVRKNLVVDMGFGVDVLRIDEMQISGSLTIKRGTGLEEQIRMDGSATDGNLTIGGANGKQLVELTGLLVRGRASIRSGDGFQSSVDLDACTAGVLKVVGGTDTDDICFADVRSHRSMVIDTGKSDVDFVTLRTTTVDKGNLSIRAKKSDAALITLNDMTVTKGGISIQTGKAGCVLNAANLTLSGNFLLKTALTTGGADDNVVDVENLEARAFVLRGLGGHTLSLHGDAATLQRGVSMRTRGDGLDVIHVQDARVVAGNVDVKCNAGQLDAQFRDLKLDKGSLKARGTNDADTVLVRGCTIAKDLQVTLRDGDDALTLVNSPTARNRKIDGGSGNDGLDVDGASTAGGKDLQKNFEGPVPSE